jgi:putative nucleotidyltransferase with HDIG domain
MNGMELLKKVKSVDPKMMVIMITSYPDIDIATEAMRLGAFDFITKPVELDLMVLIVKKALERRRLEKEVESYQGNLESLINERTAKLQGAYQNLKGAFLDIVKVLVNAIDAKNPDTHGHSDRVKTMSAKIGIELGLDKTKLEILEYGALFHDIGMMGINHDALQKQISRSPEENQMIREHPLVGVKMVEGIAFFKDKMAMIRHHHEHFDGSGYPDGLAGETIPLVARIIAVADAFDTMKHGRRMNAEDVLMELEKEKGKKFDPRILGIFLDNKIYSILS